MAKGKDPKVYKISQNADGLKYVYYGLVNNSSMLSPEKAALKVRKKPFVYIEYSDAALSAFLKAYGG